MWSGSTRPWVPWLALAVVALIAASAATFPAITQTATHVGSPIDHPDTTVGIWWPTVVAESLASGQSPFFVTDLNWPEGQDTRLVLWSFTLEALFLPLPLLFEPIQAMNIMMFLILVLNGLACGWAARQVTDSWLGAAVAVVVGATSAYAFCESSFGRPQQALWAPMVVYLGGLVQLERHPGSWKARAICAVSLALSATIYWFYGYFLGVLTLLLALAWALQGKLTRGVFLDFALVGVAGVVLSGPFMAPVILGYLENPQHYDGVKEDHADHLLLQMNHAFALPGAFIGSLSDNQHEPSNRMPISIALLLLVGFWRGRGPVRWLSAIGLTASAFALGPELLSAPNVPFRFNGNMGLRLPQAFLNYLPGWPRFWWPYRWQGVSYGAAAMVGAWALPRLPRARWFVAAFALLHTLDVNLILQGGWRRPHAVQSAANVPEVFHALAAMDGERPILQAPLATHPNSLLGWQVYHQQPIDGGVAWQMSGVRTEGYDARRETVPLWVDLQRIWHDEEPLRPARQPWTVEDTGGYHYVMMYPNREIRHDLRAIQSTTAYLGPPFWDGPMVVLWALDGVADVPDI